MLCCAVLCCNGCGVVWYCAGGSVIQGSAGEAAIVAFLAALTRKQQEYAVLGLPQPRRDDMVVFASDQAHAIIKKACMVLGIGHFCVIPTTAEENFSLNPSALREAVQREIALGHVPIVAVATTGTTSSCAFDSLTDIAAKLENVPGLTGSIWLHVDAAYGSWKCYYMECRYVYRIDGLG